MRIPGALLPYTASYRPYAGQTAHGPTYGGWVNFRCRIEPKRDVYRDRDGTEIVTSAMLFAFPEAPVAPQGEVVFAGTTYEVVAVERLPGPTGTIHHIEALLR